MHVELHVEALVLEGIPPREGERVQAAVESELARLLTERGAPPVWAWGGTVSYVDGGVIETPPGSGGTAIGVRIAQAVYEGLWQ